MGRKKTYDVVEAKGFGCTVLEMRQLMKVRGAEGVREIHEKYYGALSLCEKLETSHTEGKSKELEQIYKNTA